MNSSLESQYIFVEKYRPLTIDNCVLPKSIKTVFNGFLKHKDFPHLLLVGSSGIGKTTAAKALCDELQREVLLINGSDEGRFLDTVRTDIKSFITSVSLGKKKQKVVLIDEADNTTYDVQCCLRAFIEEFSEDCRFIFTCNYVNKILPAIHSRSTVLNFIPNSVDKKELMLSFLKYLNQILFLENIVFDKKVLVGYVKKYYPDWRRLLNEVQSNSSTGELITLINDKDLDHDELIKLMKDKNFDGVREWIVGVKHIETSTILIQIYHTIRKMHEKKLITDEIVADVIIIIAKYLDFSTRVIDQEINLIACCMEIMIIINN